MFRFRRQSPHLRQKNRNRRLYVLAVTIPLILVMGVAVYFSLRLAPASKAVWYNDDWSYRVKIPVTAHTTAETNVYFSKTIDTSDTNKFQSDCGDLRFTDAGGKLLQYYIASGCSSASTVVHVLVPSFPAGASDYYYYYGNVNASNGFESADFTAGSGVTVGTVGSEEKGTGPQIYWNLNEGTGSDLKDQSGNHYDGTFAVAGGVPTWQSEEGCMSGKCLGFLYGTDSAGIQPTSSNLVEQNTTGTVSFWAKVTQTNSRNVMFSVARYTTSDTSLIIDYDNRTSGGSNVYVAVTRDGTAQWAFSVDTTAFNAITQTNSWHHYTLTHNGTIPTFYIDGKAVAITYSVSTNKTRWFYDLFNGPTYPSDFIVLGHHIISTSVTYPMKGFIDEFKIYGSYQSASQVQANYNSRGSSDTTSTTLGTTTKRSLSDGLVGYWEMDESAANSCTGGTNDSCDQSGHAFDGAWNNDTTAITGKYGYGTDYDGTNDSTSVSDNDAFSANATNQLTVSAWLYPDAASGTRNIISKGAASNYEWSLGSNGTQVQAIIWTSSGSVLGQANMSSEFTASTWQHFAFTVNLTTNTLMLYKNGVLGTTSTLSGTYTNGTAALRFGERADGSNDYDGKIDEVRIYNKVLSVSDIKALYSTTPGPIGYWKMDEKTGTSAFDASGNSQTGSFTGTPGWVSGKYGGALSFDGSTQAVTATITDPGYSNSVETWIYPTTSVASKTLVTASKLATDSSSRPSYGSCVGTTLSLLTWTHIAAISDGSGSCKIFQNGVLTATNTTGVTFGTSIAIASSSFSGVMDDVRVYNYPRTAQQVVEDMNGGHPIGGSPIGSYTSYWKMDEGFSTTAHDYNSTNANDLTLSAASWNPTGKINKSWNGTGSVWLTRADDDDFDIASTDDASISMWFKSANASNPGSTEYLFAKGRGTPPGYSLYMNTSGFLCYSIDDDVTWTPDDSACTATDVYDATWHHVVAEKTGTTEIRVYIDGKSMGSDTSVAATGTLANTGILYVGDDDGDATNAFNGNIDEVKFYRSALTQEQVNLDYNAGSGINFGAGAALESSTLTDGTGTAPINYWNFDEKTGTTSNDIGSGAKNGTISGNTTWTKGKNGSALLFDGTAGVDAIGAFTPPAIMTYGTWLNARGLGENSLGRIAVHSNFDIFLQASSVQFQANWSTAGKWTVPIPTFGTWHHLVVVYNSGSVANDPTIYIDGVSQTVTETQTPVGSITLSSATLRIGNTSADDRTFDGSIDDTKIYDYARTAAQVAYDFNRGGPQGYWKFNECQGTTLNDSSGLGNTGTITIGASGVTPIGTCNTSSTAWGNGVTGKYNSSLSFDGTDDYALVTDSASLSPTASVSISQWIYPTAAGGAGADVTTLMKGDIGVSTDQSYGFIFDNNRAISFRIGSTSTTDILTCNTVLTLNTWNHLVGVYNGTNMYVYLNGSLCTSASTAIAALKDTAESLSIGASVNNTNTPVNYFTGRLDDTRIYSYALSANQIKRLFDNDSSAFFGPTSGSP